MAKLTKADRSKLSNMKAVLKSLQTQLATAKKVEGLDEYIAVKGGDFRTGFERTKVESGPDKAIGRFQFVIAITAKQTPVYIPLSITSGKTVSGFMYHIEGTGEGSVATASVDIKEKGVTRVSVGTLQYAKIPAGTTAIFRLDITIRGQVGKKYSLVVDRINYKLAHTDPRYQQYLKPIVTKMLKFA
jgi:hypothetical protein